MISLKHFVIKLIAAAILVSVSFAAQSASIRVSQESSAGAGDFDANILGNIDSFATGLTISQYYQYGSPNAASYNGELNGGPIPLSSTTQGFFVDASNGLHYVVVHDNPNDGSGGNTQMTTLLSGGAGGSAAFTVGDDPGEGFAVNDVAADRVFDTTHNWIACCTDGYAIGDLGASFLMFAMFDTAPNGISRWLATGSSGNLPLVLAAGREVRFDLAPVPIPAAAWLFASALGIFGFAGKRKRTT